MASNDSNEYEETECLCAECGDYAEVFNADGTPSQWVRMRDGTTWRCAACEVKHEEYNDESECLPETATCEGCGEVFRMSEVRLCNIGDAINQGYWCVTCDDDDDDESECESLPDDPDDHTTGYLMPDGRLVVVDDDPLFIPVVDAAVGIVPAVDDEQLFIPEAV